MVKKRQTLNEAIAHSMEGRAIGASLDDTITERTTLETQKDTKIMQNHTKGYKSNIVSIRFDAGDYERLKEIAQEQGTNGASLIRKAVKDLIKTADHP